MIGCMLLQSAKQNLNKIYETGHSLYGTSFYNSWRAIRFTIKGKAIGTSKEWESFDNFRNDMYSSYSPGLRLCRTDKSKPFSKDNCKWVDKSELTKAKLASLTYNGQTKTLVEWCADFKLHLNGVKLRYYRKKYDTPEKILFGLPKRKKRPLLNSADLKQVALRSKAGKMISAYRCKDRKRGYIGFDLTPDWFIEHILCQTCCYCGTKSFLGADRLDNTRGHSKDNIVPACYPCNAMRGDRFTHEEMILLGSFIKEKLPHKIIGEQNGTITIR
jgi:hypothetical protein